MDKKQKIIFGQRHSAFRINTKTKFRCLLLLGMILLLLPTFTGCKCIPETVDWYLGDAVAEMTFVNGVTRNVTCRPSVSLFAPFGAAHEGMTYIRFNDDKTVVFKPMDGEELHGTFTYKHHFLAETSIIIQLDNGEVLQGHCASGYGFIGELRFEYKGCPYFFQGKDHAHKLTPEKYEEDVQHEIVDQLRKEYYQSDKLLKTEIRYENGFEFIDEAGEIRSLSSGDMAIYAVKLTRDNQIIVLNELETGECWIVPCFGDSPDGTENDVVTVYYIEPHRDDYKMLKDLIWLPEDASGIERIDICIMDGSSTEERTITEESALETLLEQLRQTTFLRIPSEFLTFDDPVNVVIDIKTSDEGIYRIATNGGHVYIDNDYWKVSQAMN